MFADLQNTIKLFITGMIGLFLYLYFHLTLGFLLIAIPFMISAPTVGGTKENGWAYIGGMVIGFALGLGVMHLTMDFRLLMIITMLIVALICICLMQVTWIGKAAFLSAGVAFLTINSALFAPTETVNNFAHLVVMFIAGVLLTWIVNRSLWPNYAYKQLAPNMQKTLLLCQTVLISCLDDKNTAEAEKTLALLLAQLSKNQALLGKANKELVHAKQLSTAANKYFSLMEDLYFYLLKLNSVFSHEINITAFKKTLSRAIEALANRFETKQIDSTVFTELDAAAILLLQDKNTSNESLINTLMAIKNIVMTFPETIEEVNQLKIQPLQSKFSFEKLRLRYQDIKNSFTQTQIIYALKIILAIAVVFFLQLWLDWAEATAALATVFIVSAPLYGKVLQISAWRSQSVIYGFSYAFLSLFLLAEYPFAITLVLLISFSLLIGAYLIEQGPKYTYIAVQGLLIYLLVIVPDYASNINVAVGFNRLLGVILGVIIVFIISKTFFPEKASEQFKNNYLLALKNFKQLQCELKHNNNPEIVAYLKTTIKYQLDQQYYLLNLCKHELYNQAYQKYLSKAHRLQQQFQRSLFQESF